MPDLLQPNDEPLHDSQGNVLRKDQMVHDAMFGDGITRGTVPLENGVGTNVLIDWHQITNSTPRLFKKFNFRIVWSDGSKGPAKLSVDNYGHGEAARYNSWVIFEPK